MQEIWKSVPGFENLYEASNLGNVRSLDRYVRGVSKAGKEHKRLRKGIVLSPANHNSGYLEVNLCKDSKPNRMLVHTVVATTFLDKPYFAQCVNHKNGNKKDNSVSNLEWCTNSHNMKHANETGLCNHAKGSRKPFAKLVESDIPKIRSLLLSGVPNEIIAAAFGVAAPNISVIKHGKAWTHVP